MSATNPCHQGYYPYGETCYSTGSLYTDRLFTGQQQLAGLGLYNYKARWYSPVLGRFLSADTLTPGGPEGLNRYSYILNNPVNGIDPSGHMTCDEVDADGRCIKSPQIISPPSNPSTNPGTPQTIDSLNSYLKDFGVMIEGTWTYGQALAAYKAILAIAERLFSLGGYANIFQAFRKNYISKNRPLVLMWGNNEHQSRYAFGSDCAAIASGGCSPGLSWDNTDSHWDTVANFDLGRNYLGMDMETLVSHELGHIFTLLHGGGQKIIGGEYVSNWNQILSGPEAPSTYRHASANSGSEMFADMFSAWVFSAWNRDSTNLVPMLAARNAMETDMAGWATYKR